MFSLFVLGCITLNSNFIWSKLGRLSNYIHSRSDGRTVKRSDRRTHNSITELGAPCVFDEEFHLAGKSRDVQQQTAPNQTGQDRNGPAGQASRTGQRLVSPRLASLLRALPWLAAGAVSIRNVGQQFDKLRPTENRRRPQDFWQCPSLCSSYLMQRNANEQREPVANLCMLCCPVAIPSPATPPPPSLSLLASLKQLVALVFNMRSLRSSVLVDGERRDRGNGRGKA